MTDPYALVGCSECKWFWICETDAETTGCRRCGTRDEVAGRHWFASGDNLRRLRFQRSKLLAGEWAEQDSWRREVRVPNEGLVSFDARVYNGVPQVSEECQGGIAPSDSPGPGADKTEQLDLLLRLLETDAGPVVVLARALFGDGVETDPPDKDYQWTKRHLQDHPRVDRVSQPETRDDAWTNEVMPWRWDEYEAEDADNASLTWAFLADEADETEQFNTGSRTELPSDDTAPETVVDEGRARKRATTLIANRSMFDSGEQWAALLRAFAAWKLGHEHTDGVEGTLFTSLSASLSSRERITDAFDRAAAAFDVGTILTLTTNPNRYESVEDAADSLVADVTALRKKLGRDLPTPGETLPATLTVIEPTSNGVPHVHLVVFGFRPDAVPNVSELKDYWCKQRGRAQQVDTVPIATDGDGWVRSDDADRGVRPCSYLCQGADAVVEASDTSAADVFTTAAVHRATGDDIPPEGTEYERLRWAAFYWATGLRTAIQSQALRDLPDAQEADDGDGTSDETDETVETGTLAASSWKPERETWSTPPCPVESSIVKARGGQSAITHSYRPADHRSTGFYDEVPPTGVSNSGGVRQDPPVSLILEHPRGSLRAEAFRLILETEEYGYYFPGLVEFLDGRSLAPYLAKGPAAVASTAALNAANLRAVADSHFDVEAMPIGWNRWRASGSGDYRHLPGNHPEGTWMAKYTGLIRRVQHGQDTFTSPVVDRDTVTPGGHG